jgi:FkbH-like protein
MLYSDEYKLISVSLEDRFSNFGVISCIILKKFEKNCFIDTWVMSCRVLKREVERLAFKKILEIAIQWNCDTIVGEYLPTKKNSIVKDLYPNLGFSILEKNEKKYTYTYDVRNNFITCTSIEEM